MLAQPSSLEKLLRPSVGDIPVAYAQQLLKLDFSPAEHERYRELSGKSQSGELTADESVELDDLLTANDVLTILHAKAQSSLQKPSAA